MAKDKSKAKPKNVFGCWIVLLTKSYGDKLITRLVKKGYGVVAAVPEHLYAPEPTNSPCATMCLLLTPSNSQTIDNAFDDIKASLNFLKAKYYSIIVVNHAKDSLFGGSNIDLNNLPKKQIRRVPYLTLVKRERPTETIKNENEQ